MFKAVLSRFVGRPLSSMTHNGKLKGKVAIITASTDGIGFSIAERLAADGASVVVSSRKESNVANAVEKLKASGYSVSGAVCHVSKASDRERLIKEAQDKFGGIDILVSNAAVNPGVGPVLESPEEAWDKIFEVNVKAAYLLSKEVLPYLRKRHGGSIVYVSSIAGFDPIALLGVYSVSKTALLGLTKTAAKDLAPENIRVNCVAPGIVITKFSAALRQTKEAEEEILRSIPMGRMAVPKEISSVVSFLVSDDASYITGETIVASGGMTSRL